MIKKILKYILVLSVLFFFSLHTHQYLIKKEALNLRFSLQNIYLFHTIFSLAVCSTFQILSHFNKFFEQLGFIYLAVLFLKWGAFLALFYHSIFTIEKFTRIEQISLLIPLIIFLFAEVYFIVKILNKK